MSRYTPAQAQPLSRRLRRVDSTLLTSLIAWSSGRARRRIRPMARAARIADQQLARMSDRELANIGLTRSSVMADPDHRSHLERDAASEKNGW